MTPADSWAARSLWLFPVTYALHAAEEYCCGETFPVWISRLGNVQFTPTAFLWLNGIAMLVMVGAVGLGMRQLAGGWPAAALATVTVINAIAHLAGTIATWTYSPGVITGTVLWLPLGLAMLRAGWRGLGRRHFAAGVLLGILAHGIVSGIVLLAQ